MKTIFLLPIFLLTTGVFAQTGEPDYCKGKNITIFIHQMQKDSTAAITSELCDYHNCNDGSECADWRSDTKKFSFATRDSNLLAREIYHYISTGVGLRRWKFTNRERRLFAKTAAHSIINFTTITGEPLQSIKNVSLRFDGKAISYYEASIDYAKNGSLLGKDFGTFVYK